CLIEHNRISNGIRLINNAGDDWLGPLAGVPIGPLAGTLSNDQCTVDVAHSIATTIEEKVIVSVPVTFRGGITPVVATFLQSFDVRGQFTGMTQFGNWSPSSGKSKPGLRFVNLSASKIEGNSSTYAATITHSLGAGAVTMITVIIGSEIADNT